MKIKPVVTSHIQTTHTSYEVDFVLEENITFIAGDSGTGKSAVYAFLQELAAEDKRIRCFNYLDLSSNYKNTIKRSKGKLFMIDNADLLLNDAMRWYIATDGNNQYIIIGRNPSCLMLTQNDIMELISTEREGKTVFRLRHCF